MAARLSEWSELDTSSSGTRTERTDSGVGRRRAAGIYGAVVTAAIFTAAGGKLPTAGLAVAVVITLVVYWVADEYAELLGEQTERGQLPTYRDVREHLLKTWPMVTASFGPVAALLLARLAGLAEVTAANVGLITAVLLLVAHAWSAARAAQLRGWRLLATSGIAAALGVVMIVLKNFVLMHLH